MSPCVLKRANVRRNRRDAALSRRVRVDGGVGGGVSPEPIFELRGPDGKTWMLYEDGTATGFPEGTLIVNRALPLLDLLRGWIKKLGGPSITNE